jgi:hypothetical protein
MSEVAPSIAGMAVYMEHQRGLLTLIVEHVELPKEAKLLVLQAAAEHFAQLERQMEPADWDTGRYLRLREAWWEWMTALVGVVGESD